jgi:hypothetical protein
MEDKDDSSYYGTGEFKQMTMKEEDTVRHII